MFDCILLMAGNGKRTNLGFNKALYDIKGKKVYEYSLDKFLSIKECHNVIIVCNETDYKFLKNSIDDSRIKLVIGGKRRQDSVVKGLMVATSNIVLIHDSARLNTSIIDIRKVYEAIVNGARCSGLFKKVSDSIKVKDTKTYTLDRTNLVLLSTPEACYKDDLLEALVKLDNFDLVDDLEAMEKYYDVSPLLIEESQNNFKITTIEDIEYAKYLYEVKNV